jgi:hypothetical protein
MNVFVSLGIQHESACAVRYCHLWPFLIYFTCPHYLINSMIFGGEKKFLAMKCVLVSSKILSQTFLILIRI